MDYIKQGPQPEQRAKPLKLYINFESGSFLVWNSWFSSDFRYRLYSGLFPLRIVHPQSLHFPPTTVSSPHSTHRRSPYGISKSNVHFLPLFCLISQKLSPPLPSQFSLRAALSSPMSYAHAIKFPCLDLTSSLNSTQIHNSLPNISA